MAPPSRSSSPFQHVTISTIDVESTSSARRDPRSVRSAWSPQGERSPSRTSIAATSWLSHPPPPAPASSRTRPAACSSGHLMKPDPHATETPTIRALCAGCLTRDRLSDLLRVLHGRVVRRRDVAGDDGLLLDSRRHLIGSHRRRVSPVRIEDGSLPASRSNSSSSARSVRGRDPRRVWCRGRTGRG